MNKERLSKILEILKHIPRDKILRDLKTAPGWSYHGPSKKTQEKIGIGKYAEPVIHIKREDLDNADNWYYYKSLPHYEILSYLSSDPNTVVNAAIKVIRGCKRKFDKVIFDGDKVTISMDDNGEEISGDNKDQLIAAYELYTESLFVEDVMLIPHLGNIGDIEDIDRLYNDEPTILYVDYPYHLEDPLFEAYFSPLKRTNGCIGKIKLMEGEFWVMSKRHKRIPVKSSWKKENATLIGGIISRLN